MDAEVRAQYVDDALRAARYDLITHRLPLFAACWVGTTTLWSMVLMTEGTLRALDAFRVQTIELGSAIVIGSVLSWAIAEGTSRTFRSAWLHRFAEARFRRELEDARDAAEAATRAKDQFLATVSHELRSPLGTILAWTQLLQRGRLDAEATAHAVDVIERTVRLQTRLIEDLLDVARITAGKLHLELSRVDVRDAVRALVDTFSVAAETKSVELVYEPGREALPVRADAVRLQQVFGNVVTNAVKFTPQGGRVVIDAGRVDDTVEVVVRDSGIGMSAEVVARVFERFHQADVVGAGRYGGLGLGLEIARYLVTLHGGTIEAESDGVGRGSTFRVGLPLALDVPERDARAGSDHPPRSDSIGAVRER